jgi:hypothetical protein
LRFVLKADGMTIQKRKKFVGSKLGAIEALSVLREEARQEASRAANGLPKEGTLSEYAQRWLAALVKKGASIFGGSSAFGST